MKDKEIIVWENDDPSKIKYIAGFDDYKEAECLNFYHKVRKLIGLKYKEKTRGSLSYLIKDGVVEYITNRDESAQ